MASAPQKLTRIAPGAIRAPPVRAASAPRHASTTSDDAGSAIRRLAAGTRATTIKGSQNETGGRRQRGLDRTSFQGRGDAEFVTRMRAEGVVGHQLVGHLLCERSINATANVDCRQLL